MNKTHIGTLVDLGLSEKESVVYLALLHEGAMSIDVITKRTELNRSTAYVQLTSLTKFGLVSSYKKGKKIIFTAESPNNLDSLLDKYELELKQKKAEINMFLPELMKLFGSTGARPVVRVFEGKEGLRAMRNDMIEQKPEAIYVITSIDEMVKVFTDKELKEFTAKREKYNIFSNVLYSMEQGEDYKPFTSQKLKRIGKKEMPFGSDVYIYDDSVSFASVGENIVGLTIVNRGIAKTMHAMFNLAWSRY